MAQFQDDQTRPPLGGFIMHVAGMDRPINLPEKLARQLIASISSVVADGYIPTFAINLEDGLLVQARQIQLIWRLGFYDCHRLGSFITYAMPSPYQADDVVELRGDPVTDIDVAD